MNNKFVSTSRAVEIINKCFDYNINPRGDLTLFNKILCKLRINFPFTEEKLKNRIEVFKIEEVKQWIKNS